MKINATLIKPPSFRIMYIMLNVNLMSDARAEALLVRHCCIDKAGLIGELPEGVKQNT